jgi:hypothetical protein
MEHQDQLINTIRWQQSGFSRLGCPFYEALSASALLPAAALLVTPRTRPGLFAGPVRLPGPACPGDQLVAFLGRQPRSPALA